MIERGKYQSLTMVNWNGFFARTFDIDDLVTTLSGGNGAGKSTTMAAFITALIPDQTLLHFRNTTEAGSSHSSRDKGLFGKLQPGVCFAALDVINSRKQRLLFGVRLQQVAGRDKKVDIKPFVIQGLPSSMKPTDVLIQPMSDQSARVRPLNEVKQAVAELDGVQFKAFNSVVDYHTQMFELGVLPKKLRNSGDRSKFYRLIEASLYGGISSAITRSLRDYLLPQNGGVKKAFQDMESALRENRITLEAIKTTQADRDLFKHLITESTNYVASDYMRHANDRKQRLESVLSLRSQLTEAKKQVSELYQQLAEVEEELELLTGQESDLELDHQSASDHLQLVQTALRQKEKIERYAEDLEELSEKLEEQIMVVEEAQEEVLVLEEQTHAAEGEVDSLQSQLADYQQALDVQQTRALQYQQAAQALSKAVEISGGTAFEPDDVPGMLTELKAEEEQVTNRLLDLKHRLDISRAAVEKYEAGLALIKRVSEDAGPENAAEKARESLTRLDESQRLIAGENQWKNSLAEARKDLARQAEVAELCSKYRQSYGVTLCDEESVYEEQARNQCLQDEAEERLEQGRDQRVVLTQKIKNAEDKLALLEKTAPAWIQANDALETLREQSGAELADKQSVMTQMQSVMEQQRESGAVKAGFAQQRDKLDSEISRLTSPGGATDHRVKEIADILGGVLLSEIYDDITLEDAPYFSAMYGPARNAVVVSDLSGVREKLSQITDCPEDVYVIEEDVDAFDDSHFEVHELEGAVCVRFSDRQIRYSRFPEIPLFGRAAREMRLEELREQREQVIEEHAKASFDEQKLQRLYQSFGQFVSAHINTAFEADPEQEMERVRTGLSETRHQFEKIESEAATLRSKLMESRSALSLLDKIHPLLGWLNAGVAEDKKSEAEQQLDRVSSARLFAEKYGNTLEKLKGYLPVLENDPDRIEEKEEAYRLLDDELQTIKSRVFSLEDVQKRRAHFAYQDSALLLDKSSELSDNLKLKLADAEIMRNQRRDELRKAGGRLSEYQQVFASLKSVHQAKAETVQEFREELHELGVIPDEGTLERAQERKEHLAEQLAQSRSRKSTLEKRATANELELKSVAKNIKRFDKEYKEQRKVAVLSKSGWCDVLRLARESDVDRRLYKRDLAYLSAGELRSMSDKSLGALRLAVADNEELRDALRASEDNAYPERKVLFYIAVYQHLRQRIRQDIIRTDDPVEAIEEMEVELARLTEELAMRENRLAISSDSVASIIKKTIQREQNRIRLLNQGLSNINFGQVNGVRLNVNIRESHETLLNGLSHQQDQHSDLFESSRYTFSEAMAKLFQRVNPHIDMGQRSPQVLGEELLDYRNYLELSVEVNRGSDGWLQAESGALSTGEAIGTGQSILLMVVQSWEEESRRLRSKDILPCRLLFLDEAARLDSKSISTLFELCDRLDMQLLIAAPENISPEKGTTYKLVRKVFKDHEHVHVVGLKGFGSKSANVEPADDMAG